TVTNAPTVSISVTTVGVAGQPTALSFSATAPTGSSIQTVAISFGDATSANLGAATTGSISHIYNAQGTYTATITATDNSGVRTSASTVVNVPPQAPIAVNVTATPTSPKPNDVVSFTATVTPATVQVLRYEWSFGDGTQRITTGNSTTHAYSEIGRKVITVTVVSNDGSRGTGTTEVVVQR
ncbi:MAG: PKD domain-containing protein, partial [Acidobacteria bacterium]|nr:PKD domain-containing protein [Acidobacteriota bacterium]